MKCGHASGHDPNGTCSECRRIGARARYAANPEKFCLYSRDKYAAVRVEVLTRYGVNGIPECHCCGERHLEFLALDHIAGGGNEHRKTAGSGWRFFYWLKRHNFPDGFRDLCHNCNMARGFLGYCPHEKEKRFPSDEWGPER